MFISLLSFFSLSFAAPAPTSPQRDSILFTHPNLSCANENDRECQNWDTMHNNMHLHSLSVSYASSVLDLKYYRIVGQENLIDVWSDYQKSAKCDAESNNIWNASCDAEIARATGSRYLITSTYILNPDGIVDASITLLDADSKDILRKEYHTDIPREALFTSGSFSTWTHYENIINAINKNDGAVGDYQASEASKPEKIKLGQWMALSKSQKINFFLSTKDIAAPTSRQSDDNSWEGRQYRRDIIVKLAATRRVVKQSIKRIRGDSKNIQTYWEYLESHSVDINGNVVVPADNVKSFRKFYEYLEYLDEAVFDEWYMNDVLKFHSYRKPNDFGKGAFWGTLAGAAVTGIVVFFVKAGS